MDPERRLAVIDLGSNSFRLVVFGWAERRWWRRVDEIHEVARVGEGLDESHALQPEPMARALRTIEMFASFCSATGVDEVRPVATSAIRDATNQAEFLKAAGRRGLDIQVLDGDAEARYGYLAAINSTTLSDGVSLDLGGGSMQLVEVAGRRARNGRSWRLGAVRMTERFLGGKRTSAKQIKALRSHALKKLEGAPWFLGAGTRGRLVGVGGTVRNLADATMRAAGLPSFGIQGHVITLEALDDLIETLADLPASERGTVPGIKPGRGDVILAGAVVVRAVMEAGAFTGVEATEAGLREGIFYECFLAGQDPPLFEDVRHAGVMNLACQYRAELTHERHVAELVLGMHDALVGAGLMRQSYDERELLWAAAMLHDIGTAVDYDDHHKHSRYLILNAGLPGFTPREIALIGQMARYHRRGDPSLGEFTPLARTGDLKMVLRCSALLRLAEQFERSRDQSVQATRLTTENGSVELRLQSSDDAAVARWAAEREVDLFERAFGRSLTISRA